MVGLLKKCYRLCRSIQVRQRLCDPVFSFTREICPFRTMCHRWRLRRKYGLSIRVLWMCTTKIQTCTRTAMYNAWVMLQTDEQSFYISVNLVQTAPFERNKNLVNPIRRTSSALCMRFNPCENHGVCHDESNGSYTCLCSFGWTGRHCEESKIYFFTSEVVLQAFHRQESP